MTDWQPITEEELLSLIDAELAGCTAEQKKIFEKFRVPLRPTPITREGHLESVYVAAQRGDEVLYYEDVEEGWNFAPLTSDGHIEQHSCNQDELKYALQHWGEKCGDGPTDMRKGGVS